MGYDELRPIADAAAQVYLVGLEAAALKLLALWWLESGWNPHLVNPHTFAAGLGGVLSYESAAVWGERFLTRPTVEELKDPKVSAQWTARLLAEKLERAQQLHPDWPKERQLRLALKWYSGGWERAGDAVFEREYWRPFQDTLSELRRTYEGDVNLRPVHRLLLFENGTGPNSGLGVAAMPQLHGVTESE